MFLVNGKRKTELEKGKNCLHLRLHFRFSKHQKLFLDQQWRNMNYSKPATGSLTFYALADVRAEIDGNKLPYGGRSEEVHMSWRMRSLEKFQEVFSTKFTVKLITISNLNDGARNISGSWWVSGALKGLKTHQRGIQTFEKTRPRTYEALISRFAFKSFHIEHQHVGKQTRPLDKFAVVVA